ncbi:MAG: hypothetical protein ACYC3W_10290 [Candidatus Nanopelagicales bacterium]
MSLERWSVVVAVAGAVGVSAAELAARKLSGDAYWDLATGRWQWLHGAVLRHDVLSWTAAGRPWINVEWAWGSVLYAASAFGAAGLWVVGVLGALGYFSGLAVLGRVVGLGSFGRVALVAFGAWVSVGFWDSRPQVWAYAAAVWTFVAVYRVVVVSWSWRVVLGAGALQVLWQQIHGSWVLAPVWWALFGAVVFRWGPLAWRVYGVAVFSFLLGFVQPWGWSGIRHAVHLVGSRWISTYIAEWNSPSWHQTYVVVGLGVYLFVAVLGLRRFERGSFLAWLLWVAFGFAGLYAIRFLPYLPLGLALLLPVEDRVGSVGVVSVFAGAVAFWIMALSHVPSGGLVAGPWVSRQWEPVGAVSWLVRHPVLRPVWNQYRWGGYLAYRGIPDWIDGRADFWLSVPGREFQRYQQVRIGKLRPGYVLWGARAALVYTQSYVPVWLKAQGWREVYAGQLAEVWTAPGVPGPGA